MKNVFWLRSLLLIIMRGKSIRCFFPALRVELNQPKEISYCYKKCCNTRNTWIANLFFFLRIQLDFVEGSKKNNLFLCICSLLCVSCVTLDLMFLLVYSFIPTDIPNEAGNAEANGIIWLVAFWPEEKKYYIVRWVLYFVPLKSASTL